MANIYLINSTEWNTRPIHYQNGRECDDSLVAALWSSSAHRQTKLDRVDAVSFRPAAWQLVTSQVVQVTPLLQGWCSTTWDDEQSQQQLHLSSPPWKKHTDWRTAPWQNISSWLAFTSANIHHTTSTKWLFTYLSKSNKSTIDFEQLG